MSRADGSVAAAGPLAFGTDLALEIDYIDNRQSREVGVAVTTSLTVFGVASMVLGGFLLDRSSDIYDSGWGVATITIGIVVTLLAGPSIIGTALVQDEGLVMATPR